ncbi:MAG: hypothetical protein ABI794_15510 [Betaproteobacteria bacterium]
MAERDARLPEPTMDATDLYREEIFTDRKVGTIRVMHPVMADGSGDPSRPTSYVGEAQMYTSMGTLPLSFDIDAASLTEAVAGYAAAAKEAVERAVRELEEYRRQSASSLVIPRAGAGPMGPGGPGGLGGMLSGGKIQMP